MTLPLSDLEQKVRAISSSVSKLAALEPELYAQLQLTDELKEQHNKTCAPVPNTVSKTKPVPVSEPVTFEDMKGVL